MKAFPHLLRTALIFVILLAACTPVEFTTHFTPSAPISSSPASTAWRYEDLLLLDPIDSNSPDIPDIFAIYYHPADKGWVQIRLDIIGNDWTNYHLRLSTNEADEIKNSQTNSTSLDIRTNLYLELFKTGNTWEATTIHFFENTLLDLPLLIEENTSTHSLIISFPEIYLGKTASPLYLSATIVGPGNELTEVAIAKFGQPLHVARAPLLLAFWDVLPANTPAQLLQRWDGAHTGPYGSRHGLKHLLAAAEENQIPVALLDIKGPGTLSGLDLINQIDYIQQLEEQGILSLPETGFSDPEISNQAAAFSHSTTLEFGFPPTHAAYGTFAVADLPEYNLLFANLEDQSHIISNEGRRIVPLPYSPWEDNTARQVLEADRNGLTRDTWQTLLDVALSPDNNDMLILGGSLITSPWGDSSIAPSAFHDLANHPWIQVLTANDLQTFSALNLWPNLGADGLDLLGSQASPWATNLKSNWTWGAIQSHFGIPQKYNPNDPAELMALQILRPTNNTDRYHLQSNYWTQLFHLWIISVPGVDAHQKSTCAFDIDMDNVTECVYASADQVATFEITDASLITASHHDDNDATQWVGPTSQIVVGMSDPLFWDLDAGTHSDPSVIPGSFILNTAAPLNYEVNEMDDDHIRFTSTDGAVSKDYYFTEDSLTVTIETDQPLSTDLVLALDPQQRFQPGWAENYNIFSQTDDSFCWGAEDGKAVCVSWTGSPEIEINTFKDSLESLSQPLDPNAVYPPGHFLPMSLATVTFSTNTDFTVTLRQYSKP